MKACPALKFTNKHNRLRLGCFGHFRGFGGIVNLEAPVGNAFRVFGVQGFEQVAAAAEYFINFGQQQVAFAVGNFHFAFQFLGFVVPGQGNFDGRTGNRPVVILHQVERRVVAIGQVPAVNFGPKLQQLSRVLRNGDPSFCVCHTGLVKVNKKFLIYQVCKGKVYLQEPDNTLGNFNLFFANQTFIIPF